MPTDPTVGHTLMQAASMARSQAYAPFSRFLVGAAVQASDGRIFLGVNIENPSFGLTLCAERAAIAAAATAGVRPPHITAVAVTAPAAHVSPCGACRQVLSHWCAADAVLWCHSSVTGAHRYVGVQSLLPDAFDLAPG